MKSMDPMNSKNSTGIFVHVLLGLGFVPTQFFLIKFVPTQLVEGKLQIGHIIHMVKGIIIVKIIFILHGPPYGIV